QQIANRIVVMDSGRIVEEGDTDAIFAAPSHDFTRRLIVAAPVFRRAATHSIQVRPEPEGDTVS
ncbi:MAG: hypothetical protein ACTHJY_23490, partial [Rhizobiaceae bacterium]